MLADLIAATFVNDPWRRQEQLEELSLNRRLRLVIQYLREENRERRGVSFGSRRPVGGVRSASRFSPTLRAAKRL